MLPGAVVFPTTAEEVAAIMELAGREGFPVIPRGAGTNLSGGTVPIGGEVVVCLAAMHRVIEID